MKLPAGIWTKVIPIELVIVRGCAKRAEQNNTIERKLQRPVQINLKKGFIEFPIGLKRVRYH